MYSLTILCCESVMGAKWGLVPHKTNIVKGLKKFQLLSEIYICIMEGKKKAKEWGKWLGKNNQKKKKKEKGQKIECLDIFEK